MKNVKTVELHGCKYMIQCHPYDEGAEIALNIKHLIGAYAMEYQRPVIEAMDSLTAEERKKFEGLNKADQQALYTELITPKLEREKSKMMDAAQNFLRALEPKKLTDLSIQLFKHVTLEASGESLGSKGVRDLHFQGNYKPVIPLMLEVIKHNDFLDLDPNELLEIQ